MKILEKTKGNLTKIKTTFKKISLRNLERSFDSGKWEKEDFDEFYYNLFSVNRNAFAFLLAIPAVLAYTLVQYGVEIWQALLLFVLYDALSLRYFPILVPPHQVDKYFEKKGYERTVMRYEFHQKILKGALISLIIFFTISFILPLVDVWVPIEEATEFYHKIPVAIWIVSIFIVYTMIPEIKYAVLRDFRYHITRGCFRILTNYKQILDIDKSHYLVFALKSYNDYLARGMKIRISNLHDVYPAIIGSEPRDYNKIITKFRKIFDEPDSFDVYRETTQIISELNVELKFEDVKSKKPIIGILSLVIATASIIVSLIN